MEFCGIHLTKNVQETLKISIYKNENYTLKITATSPRGEWVNHKKTMLPILETFHCEFTTFNCFHISLKVIMTKKWMMAVLQWTQTVLICWSMMTLDFAVSAFLDNLWQAKPFQDESNWAMAHNAGWNKRVIKLAEFWSMAAFNSFWPSEAILTI